jgi:hypothetical protein
LLFEHNPKGIAIRRLFVSARFIIFPKRQVRLGRVKTTERVCYRPVFVMNVRRGDFPHRVDAESADAPAAPLSP